MAQGDLTTVANVNAWMTVKTVDAAADALTARVISQCSAVILGYIERSAILPTVISEVTSGLGSDTLMLREWPVISVASVSVGGVAASKFGFGNPYPGRGVGSPAVMSGLGIIDVGVGNVTVGYKAGYMAAPEMRTIPAGSPYELSPNSAFGQWASDEGVTFDTGTKLTAIETGTPTTGQYLPPSPFDPVSPRSKYTFAAADAGKKVVLGYGFIPSALEQACIELVAERLKYRSRIGERSHSSGGSETVSFELTDMSLYIKQCLAPFRRMFPG